jgi:hypothetical protein
VLKAAKDWKVCQVERDSAFSLIMVMKRRIFSKDSTIDNLSVAMNATDSLRSSYKNEIANLVDQRDKQEADMRYYENLYKRQRFKTTITGIAGIAGVIAVFFLKK